MTASAQLREAYGCASQAWSDGPDLIYSRLAQALVLGAGVRWPGLVVLDVGAGSGTASRVLRDAGATPVLSDPAMGMLMVARAHCAASAVGADALALPFLDDSVDAAVVGFVLNHIDQPWSALAEARRVVRPGGWVLASTWAREDGHPVRAVVEEALLARGWRRPEWYDQLKQVTSPQSDTVELVVAAARRAGLVQVNARNVTVELAEASTRDLVEWRLGMPHSAPFVAGLPAAEQIGLIAETVSALADAPPLCCQTVMLASRVAA